MPPNLSGVFHPPPAGLSASNATTECRVRFTVALMPQPANGEPAKGGGQRRALRVDHVCSLTQGRDEDLDLRSCWIAPEEPRASVRRASTRDSVRND